jgi:replicative DNA helicase
MEFAPSCSSAEEYAKAVYQGYRRRQLREIGETLVEDAFSHEKDADQILNEVRSALDSLAEKSSGGIVKSPSQSLQDFLVFRHDVNEGKRKSVKVGFPSLDGILGGFAPGGLYIIAARPGVGKSALGIAMADMLAKNYRVLYVSLEMTEEELNARRIAAFSADPSSYSKLLFGKTTPEEDVAIYNACGVLNERQLFLSSVPSMTVAELGMQTRNVQADVVVVDYLGLMTGADRKASEYDRITQVSGDLKRLAKRLGCVVLALCQLNRESVGSADTRPKLSQLRSSGAIEQDADGVLLIHRPEYGQKNTKRSAAEAEQFFVDVAKNRHGRTGTIELAWYAPVNRFEDRSGRWTVKSWT